MARSYNHCCEGNATMRTLCIVYHTSLSTIQKCRKCRHGNAAVRSILYCCATRLYRQYINSSVLPRKCERGSSLHCCPAYTVFGTHQQYKCNFNCCLSVHVDNYTIIVPTKCTSFLLLKAQNITFCNFCLCILSPYMFQPAWVIFRGAMPVPS
jgi:hypothetical protein